MTIGIIHARIHYQIKKHSQERIVDYALVKEWVSRIIIRNGGIPREDIPKIIEEMCEIGFLKKKCRLKYEIMPNNKINVREPLI